MTCCGSAKRDDFIPVEKSQWNFSKKETYTVASIICLLATVILAGITLHYGFYLESITCYSMIGAFVLSTILGSIFVGLALKEP